MDAKDEVIQTVSLQEVLSPTAIEDNVKRVTCECMTTASHCQCNLVCRYPTSNNRVYFSVFLFFIILVVDVTLGSKATLSRKKRYSPAVFPSNSEIEVAWEVGIPVGLEGKDVEVGLFLEADYSLPDNVTYLYPDKILNTYTGKKRRSTFRSRRSTRRRKRGPVTRAGVFFALERTMDSLGMDGHSCLLRGICEAAETPLYHGSLVAELLHVLFTPSTTSENDIDSDYLEAEDLGKSGVDCFDTYPDCSTGLFDIVTMIQED